MIQKSNIEQLDPLIEEQRIVEYLQDHKDFFDRHADVLTEMAVPHESGGGASLIERQVEALRGKNQVLKEKLNALVSTAKQNEVLNQHLYEVSLTAIELSNLDTALDALTEKIKDQFGVPLVAIRISYAGHRSTTRVEVADPDDAGYQQVHARIAHGQSVCDDRLPSGVLSYLFGIDAEQVGSCALVPLGGHQPLGILVLASPDKDRFRADLGTLFLDRLGTVVGRLLKRLLG